MAEHFRRVGPSRTRTYFYVFFQRKKTIFVGCFFVSLLWPSSIHHAHSNKQQHPPVIINEAAPSILYVMLFGGIWTPFISFPCQPQCSIAQCCIRRWGGCSFRLLIVRCISNVDNISTHQRQRSGIRAHTRVLFDILKCAPNYSIIICWCFSASSAAMKQQNRKVCCNVRNGGLPKRRTDLDL